MANTENIFTVRTAHGTVHALTIGRTYKMYGSPRVNKLGVPNGKADCGALTSSAATLTDEPVTCVKCSR
jgi:hypothetical protein